MTLQEAIRAEFSRSLSWYQLLYLSAHSWPGALTARLELAWWKAASVAVPQAISEIKVQPDDSASASHPVQLRQAIMKALVRSGQPDIDVAEKEAIYQHLKQASHGLKPVTLADSGLTAIMTSPDVAAARKKLEESIAEEQSLQERRINEIRIRGGLRWTDIPIAHVSTQSKANHPELDGIHEEVLQARRQLRAVRLVSEDLGRETGLFDLRNIATLLDLYRHGTDDIACIDRQVFNDLYKHVRAHTSRVLALALSIADSKGIGYSMNRCSPGEDFVGCIQQADMELRALSTGAYQTSTPRTLAAFVRQSTSVSTLGHTSQQTAAARTEESPLFRALTEEKKVSDPPNVIEASEYSIAPHEYENLLQWDPDLVLDDTQQFSHDGASVWESPSESGSEVESASTAKMVDEKLEESDRLEDAIYEQKLWDSLSTHAQGHMPSEASESPGGASDDDDFTSSEADEGTGSEADDGTGSEADEGIGLEMLDSDSEEEDVGAIRSASDGNTGNAASTQHVDQEDCQRPSKRQRTSEGPLTRGLATAGFGYDRKRKRSYRTSEFISTSDEEGEV